MNHPMVKAMIEAYSEGGLSIGDLAEALPFSYGSIWHILVKAGVHEPRPQQPCFREGE
jgi:hypothetical protein